jgi:hypothetical protein
MKPFHVLEAWHPGSFAGYDAIHSVGQQTQGTLNRVVKGEDALFAYVW